MISVKNVFKSYNNGKIEVLKNVSLDISDGEFAVILGTSGSGKSTLMNIISGLEKPDKGSILVNESDISAFSDKQLTEFRKNHIGFVFQQYYLLPHLNVENNIKLGADLAKNADFGEIVQSLGLTDKLKQKPAELSGGEQQRVCIARALAKNPKLLLCDEPTGALDYQTGKSVLKLLQNMCIDNGVTVVVIKHNMALTPMGNKVIKVKNGAISDILVNDNPTPVEEIEW